MPRQKTRQPRKAAGGLSAEGRRLARATRGASREAIAETFALGLPITNLKRGRLYHRFPDGTEVPVSKEEMLKVAGMVYP